VPVALAERSESRISRRCARRKCADYERTDSHPSFSTYWPSWKRRSGRLSRTKPPGPAPSAKAAGSVPLLRNRLCVNEVAQAEFMMVFDAQLYEPHAARWWADFARMNRSAFEKQAADLIRPHGALAGLRAVASTSAGTS
jgi:hypothetical protein